MRDKFAEFLGIELLERRPGHAKTRVEVDERVLNGLDIVHGGAIFTLADYAFAMASNTDDRVAVSLNAQISYINPGVGPYLTAEADEIDSSDRTGAYQVHVRDANGNLVATFSGLAYYKKQRA